MTPKNVATPSSITIAVSLCERVPMVAPVESLDARNRASQSSLEHLGAAYQELKRLPEARKVLERVAVLDPSNPRHLMALARVAYFLNDREGALGYLAHARELALTARSNPVGTNPR